MSYQLTSNRTDADYATATIVITMTDVENNKNTQSLKSCSQADEDFKGLFAADAAAGDKNNDQIKTCLICAENGFPHEPILFEKVPGRILADGTNETKSYRVLDYVTNEKHEHKNLWKDLGPKLWQQAMEGS